MPRKDLEKIAADTRAWRQRNPGYSKAYYAKNRERINERERRWHAANPHKAKEVRARIKAQFFAAYGTSCVGTCDGTPCEWSVTTLDVLTIGHLFNDGKEHRKRIGGSGTAVVADLKKRGWPKDEGIAPQCANCQLRDRIKYSMGGRRKQTPTKE